MAFLGDFTTGDEVVMHMDGEDNCLCVVVDDNRVEVVTDTDSLHHGKVIMPAKVSSNLQTIASMVVERKSDGKKNLLSIHCWCLSLTEHVARKLIGAPTIPSEQQWMKKHEHHQARLAHGECVSQMKQKSGF